MKLTIKYEYKPDHASPYKAWAFLEDDCIYQSSEISFELAKQKVISESKRVQNLPKVVIPEQEEVEI